MKAFGTGVSYRTLIMTAKTLNVYFPQVVKVVKLCKEDSGHA